MIVQGSDKPGKNRVFCDTQGKPGKLGILEKYFKFQGILLRLSFATIYFKWHYSLFTLYTTVIAGFFYLHIFLV